jgi:selenocysteine-specific elongation factor
LNLAGVTTEELSRGMMLAPTDTFKSTTALDVQLSLLPDAKPLKHGARVHFHAYTMETIAEVRLYEVKQLKHGEQSLARLKLAELALLLPGDRFILRQFSPVVTIGGGVVVDAAPATRNLRIDESLKTLTGTDHEAILRTRIWRNWHDGIWLQELVEETGWRKEQIESLLLKALQSGQVVRIDDIFLLEQPWVKLKSQIVPTLSGFHDRNPLVDGIGKKELQIQTDASVDVVFEEILRQLAQEKKIEVAGDRIHLPGRGVVMKDEETESKKIIEQAFASAGLKVPFLRDVLAGVKIDKVRAQKIVTLLLRDRVLIRISEELVFHQSAIIDLRQKIAALKATTPKIDVARFKDMTGVSRKYAIPLLEYLDRERVTRRVGDERVIL